MVVFVVVFIQRAQREYLAANEPVDITDKEKEAESKIEAARRVSRA